MKLFSSHNCVSWKNVNLVSLPIGTLGKVDSRHCRLKNTYDAEPSVKGFPVIAGSKN